MFRHRWVRRVGPGLVALAVLGVAGLFGYRYRCYQRGEEHFTAVTARLDATDPGWRLDSADMSHVSLPDDQNSALTPPRVVAALAGGKFEVKRVDGKFVSTSSNPPNRVPDQEDWIAIDRAFEGNSAALAIARSFKDLPRGWRTRPPGQDLITFRMGNIADTRTVFTLLNEEAKRLARDGRPGAAFELVRALLNAARSIDGDILLIDALVRLAGDAMVVGRVQGILAQTRPQGGLGLVQAALTEEAEADFLWRSFRGERALVDQTFQNIAAGMYPFRSALVLDPKVGSPPGPADQARDWLEAPMLPAEHAGFLEQATRACDVARLPADQQRKAFQTIVVPDSPPVLAAEGPEQLKAFSNILDASLRTRAHLRCAMVGVAVERYRLIRGHWPTSLAEIPPNILPAVPLDPFDGKPLKYVHRDDGVTVYSVGADEQDNGGEVGDNNGAGNKPGTDICFRLYNPDQRGLPPLPGPPRVEDDEPEKPTGPEPRVVGDGP
jgi:hypothetical protein